MQSTGGICFCGHDCGRCLVYLATVTGDSAQAAAYREEARVFYRDRLGLEISSEKLVCFGGHSDAVLEVCHACPFRKCCRERKIDRCKDCPEYPCGAIADYETQWVNKGNQK